MLFMYLNYLFILVMKFLILVLSLFATLNQYFVIVIKLLLLLLFFIALKSFLKFIVTHLSFYSTHR